MKIQVLGSGCPTCKGLYDLVVNTVKEAGMDEQVEYITDINKLIEEGIATSPALKINNKVVCAGRVPSVEELKGFLSQDKVNNDNKGNNKDCSCGGCC